MFVEVCVGAMQRIGGLLCVAVQDLALRDLAQYVAVGGSMFAARCSVLLCVAACCSVLQCVAVQDLALADLAHTHLTECIQIFDALCDIFCKTYRLLKLQFRVVFVQQVRQRTQRQFCQHAQVGRLFVAVCCRMLQCVAVWCNVLQR